jgi:hypothetical protein
MRNSLFRLLVAALLSSLVCASLFARAEEPKDEKAKKASQLGKTTGSPIYQPLNCNNMLMWFGANGNGSFPPSKTGDGTIYPRGTSNVMYEDGLMWGGRVYQDAARTKPGGLGQPIRIGGNEYNMGNQAGWIVGSGASAVAADQNLPSVRIYRIRRDWLAMTADELKRDAGESNEIDPASATPDQIAAIIAQYAKDWDEWPVAQGAPYVERNGIPGYQKPPKLNYDETAGKLFTADSLVSGHYDEPGVAGGDVNLPADQVLWTAYNDLNRSLTTALYGSEPMGLECQVTCWGYKRTDAMGNCDFRRYRLINKGGAVIDDSNNKGTFYIDSMYVCQWSDPDLGEAGDDIVGCDTLTSLGYIYNGVPIDNMYAGYKLPPPAAGWDFFAGAMVPGKSTDSAVYNFKRVYGKRNLPMTGFAYFSAGSALSDPRPRTYSIGGMRWWKMLRGYAPQDGADVYYPFPPGLTPGPFPLSGDPVTGKGFVDGLGQAYSFSPGDRRLLLNSGPFSLAPGDTNEIVVALVAGIGADRLSSVSVMKFNDQFAQNTFDALFVVPTVPSPNVNFTNLDRTVVLDWGWDPNTIDKSENRTINPGGYVFEGYNVYQLPTQGANLDQGKRLATYDLINAYSVLLDLTFDQASGLIITKPVQYGSNSGVEHVFKFSVDALADKPALNNGQDYFLGVTAYYRSTVNGFLPQVLESSPARARVTPQKPVPGTQYNGTIGDAITASHSAGTAEGSVKVQVIDPSRLTGDSYRVTFTGSGATKTYNILDVTTGKTLFFGGKNYGTDWGGTVDAYPTADGMIVRVSEGAGVSNTTSKWTGGAPWFQGSGLFGGDAYAGFGDGIVPAYVSPTYFGAMAPSFPITSVYPIELRFDINNGQKAYRLVRNSTYTSNNYVIGKSIVGANTADTLPVINVPFTAWDVSKTPARQLTIGIRDGDRNGKWNITTGDALELIWIYNKSYDPTMTQFGTTIAQYQTANIGTGGPLADIVYAVDLSLLAGQTQSATVGTLLISPKLTFTTTDQYTFSPGAKAAVRNNTDLAKAEVEKINVFPNPYYAFNPQETNRFARFVTFNHLPPNCTVRIFNLAGHLVRSLVKDGTANPTQFIQWDLNNQYGYPVASGIYIAYIDMPDLGKSKVLKVAVIQEQEVLDIY